MVGENLESSQASKQETEWDGLSGGTFDKTQAEANVREAQEQVEVANERQELERATVDKINEKPKAKNIFKRIALGVLLSAVIVGGAAIGNIMNSNHETANAPISIERAIENTTQHFIDIDSEDLVWTESFYSGGEMTDLGDGNYDYIGGSRISINNDSVANDAIDTPNFENIDRIEIDWWQGHGDMYRAIDTDGNGTWDVAERLNPYTNESETIQLGEEDSSSATTMQEIQSQFDKAQ